MPQINFPKVQISRISTSPIDQGILFKSISTSEDLLNDVLNIVFTYSSSNSGSLQGSASFVNVGPLTTFAFSPRDITVNFSTTENGSDFTSSSSFFSSGVPSDVQAIFSSAPCALNSEDLIKSSQPGNVSIQVSSADLSKQSQKIFIENQFNDPNSGFALSVINLIQQSNPLFGLRDFLNSEISKTQVALSNGSSSSSTYQNDRDNNNYLTLLNNASSVIEACIANGMSFPPVPVSQTGRFLSQVLSGIEQTWSTANHSIQPVSRTTIETPTVVASGSSYTTVVSQSQNDLENQANLIKGNNQIIYNQSSGVNIFTNPAGDILGIYSILDIMRKEPSSFIFENPISTITTVPQNSPIVGGNSNCLQVLEKLSLVALTGLLTALSTQSKINLSKIQQTMIVVNKMLNSPSFQLSLLISGFSSFNFSTLNFNGSYFDNILLQDLLNNISNSKNNISNFLSNNPGQNILNSIESIGSSLLSILTQAEAEALKDLKNSATAIEEILKTLDIVDLQTCSLISNAITSANNPTLVSSTIANISIKTQKDMTNLQSNLQDLLALSKQQQQTSEFSSLIQTAIKSRG